MPTKTFLIGKQSRIWLLGFLAVGDFKFQQLPLTEDSTGLSMMVLPD